MLVEVPSSLTSDETTTKYFGAYFYKQQHISSYVLIKFQIKQLPCNSKWQYYCLLHYLLRSLMLFVQDGHYFSSLAGVTF